MFIQFYWDHLFTEMHLLIASLMCCVFVLTGVHAEGAEDTEVAESVKEYNCEANVPSKAKDALLDAINGKRAELAINASLKMRNITNNDCTLAKEAFTNTFGAQSHRGFEIKSVFDDDWEEMLKKEVSSKNQNGMINAATSVGCGIKLSTKTDGSHQIEVEYLFNDPSRRSSLDSVMV